MGQPTSGDAAHPRVRGERIASESATSPVPGSSPRARGAHVGRWDPVHRAAAHPRVRGEHRMFRLSGRGARRFIPACAGNALPGQFPSGSRGSSPRARGTLIGLRPSSLAVHPRVRGERYPPYCRIPSCGSSPRVRGTRRHMTFGHFAGTVHPRVCGEHVCHAAVKPIWRFIPACAGNAGHNVDGRSEAVHPRVCGERPVTFRA